MHIAVVGSMGVGKSTLISRWANLAGMTPWYEIPEQNPFFEASYRNPERWVFASQLVFLSSYAKQQKMISEMNQSIHCQDMSLDAGLNTYVKVMHKLGRINDDELATLEGLHEDFLSGYSTPDIHIVLDASTECILDRVSARDREIERGVDPDFVDILRESLFEWVDSLPPEEVYTVNVENFDVFNDDQVMTLLAETWKRLKR